MHWMHHAVVIHHLFEIRERIVHQGRQDQIHLTLSVRQHKVEAGRRLRFWFE